MRARMYLVSAVAAGCLLVLPAAGAAQCDPDGDVEFVCGPVSPEDLAAVPDSPWVVVSSMTDDGRLYATDARDHTSRPIFPLDTSAPRHDTALYGACPGPDTSGFRPHGLGLRPGDDGVHTLYVVRHGARESVEVFEIDARGEAPAATWVGCAVAPRGRGPELGLGAPGPRLRRHQLPALHRRAVGVAAGRGLVGGAGQRDGRSQRHRDLAGRPNGSTSAAGAHSR